MSSTALLGWLGAALSMSLPWPQVWRSCIKGRTGGLSATASWLGLAMPVGWITYGLLTGETVQVVTNSVNGTAGLGVLIVVLVKQPDIRTPRKLLATAGPAVAVLTAAGACVAAAALTGATGAQAAAVLGMILAGTSFVSAIPQPLSLLRDRTQDLSGLSPLRWRLAAAACASWMTYGLTTGQTAVWLSAGVGLTSATIVCWVLFAAARPPAVTASPAVAVTASLAVAPAVTASPAVAVPTMTASPAMAPTTTASLAVAAAAPAARGVAPVVRPARGTARVVRPAAVTWPVFPAAVVRPVSARVVRPAAAVTRSARPVSGAARPAPARVPRPARAVAARPARGIARVATA